MHLPVLRTESSWFSRADFIIIFIRCDKNVDKAIELILDKAQTLRSEIWNLAESIGRNPEEGYKEYYAVKLLTGYLKENGFQVITPLARMDTAFLASFKGDIPGPRIAFLAEYDALPDIGHACGHNLIGAASVGAAVVLSKIPDMPGEVIVVGCPAEETSGAKVALAENKVFDGMDAAMMFHPGSCNVPEISSLALDALEISFYGRAAHMAVSENRGINALDALINFFVMVNKLKKKLAKDERIDGIIVEGGRVPNIVPDKTTARFYLRAGRRENLNRIRLRVIQCAEKAAREIGAQMRWRYYEYSYDEMLSNSVLAQCFKNNLVKLGIKEIEPPQTMLGSVDMGNVSHIVPAIHSYLCMGRGTEIPHTLEFARTALSEEGEKVLFLAVRALSLTGWDVLTDERLLEKIKREFQKSKLY